MSSGPSDRPRVLVLIKGLGIGGAERLIADGSRYWNRAKYEYSVAYILPWKDQLVSELEGEGVGVTCIGGSRGLDLRTPTRLRSLISEGAVDLIHAHLPSAGVLARFVTTTPVVYTEHNIAGSYREPTRTLNRLSYRRNRAVICVSEAVRESVSGFSGPTPRVIPNGVPALRPGSVSDVRAEFGIDASTKLIVHVGNIRPYKGHGNLILATRQLAESDKPFLVLSVGTEKRPGDLERVRQEADAAGVSDYIRFLGRRADARRLIGAADVVVNPSDVEGLPVVLLEALAMARPVVATDVGGVATVIIDRETGLLVPPADPEALAEALVEAMENPDSSAWGEAGAALVESRHSMAQMIEEYEEVYREVLDG